MRAAVLLLAAAAACRQAPRVETTDDFGSEWEAARACFLEANVVLFRALAARRYGSLRACLDAEDDLDDAVKARILDLTDHGIAHARAAAALRPERVEGHLALGLNLAASTVARSRLALLLEGVPGRIREAYERALAIDPAFWDGGALLLKGRFLTRSPEPWRDLAEAKRALEASLEVAPSPIGSLFLGDACEELGLREDALRAWHAAAEGAASGDEAGRLTAALALERLRLAGAK